MTTTRDQTSSMGHPSNEPNAQLTSATQCNILQVPRIITSENCIPVEDRIIIEWVDLQCSLPAPGALHSISKFITGHQKHKRVLSAVSGCAGPGDLVCIMGPPNSGKTTLLNILSGILHSSYGGEVRLNNRLLEPSAILAQSCFVPQRNWHLDDFSVKETLWMAVELKHPTATQRRFKFNMVVNQLERFGLMDVRKCPVQKISKQHKRLLTGAVELMRLQPLIIADEPFYNVDAAQTQMYIKMLRYMAYKGHTVICSMSNITSNVFQYFTKIYVLSEGRTIYSGAPDQIISTVLPYGFICPSELPVAEFILQVACKMHGGVKVLAETEEARAPEVPNYESAFMTRAQSSNSGKKMSNVKKRNSGYVYESLETDQLELGSVIFNRLLFYTFRSGAYMSMRQCLNICMVVVLASIFKSTGFDGMYTDMNLGFLYLILLSTTLISLLASTTKTPIIDEYALYEILHVMYHKKTYFIARLGADLIFETMFSMSSSIFLYYLTFQVKNESRIFFFLCTMLLVNFCSHATGQLLGLLFKTHFAILTAAALYLYNLTFSGMMLNLNEVSRWLRVFPYASILFHARNILVIDLYGNGRKIDCGDQQEGETVPVVNQTCMYINGTDVLKSLDVQEHQFYPCLVTLIATTVTIWLISYKVFCIRVKWRDVVLKLP